MATQLRRVLGLPALASLISFGALVAFSAVNLAYLMVLTGGFRRPVRMVNFSEAA